MRLSGPDEALAGAKDALIATAVITGIGNGVQGARLARHVPMAPSAVQTGM